MFCNCDSEKTVFFPIDIQRRYLRVLGDEGGKQYACAISFFVDALAHRGIETIPVAMSSSFPERLYTWPFPESGGKNFFESLVFCPEFFPKTSNAVYVKERSGAFEDGVLKRYIDKNGINTVLIAGMYTTQCVVSSIGEALQTCSEDVSVVVVENLLADNCLGWSARSVAHHKAEIEAVLLEHFFPRREPLPSRLSYASSEEVLARYKLLEPAPRSDAVATTIREIVPTGP